VAASWLATALIGGSPNVEAVLAAADAADAWLAELDAHLAALRELVPLPTSLVLVGRGPSLAVARGGALVLKEAAKVHAEGLSGGQFRHGPIELAEPGFAALVLQGPPATAELARRLATDLAATGATTRWLGAGAPPAGVPALPQARVVEGAAELLPSTVTLQLLAHVLGEARGVVPGEFRHASKVTAVL
jgi:glucosamine--fructose-6-phosphate aminotransferase (isomerizing)